MNLKPAKKQLARMVEVLSEDYDTVEEAASAALSAAWELYEERGKYTVAGQLFRRSDGHRADGEDKVSLGLYATRKQAETAADSLIHSSMTHEEMRVWVLPVHHDTPASLYKERKQLYAEEEQGVDEAVAELTEKWREVKALGGDEELRQLMHEGDWYVVGHADSPDVWSRSYDSIEKARERAERYTARPYKVYRLEEVSHERRTTES